MLAVVLVPVLLLVSPLLASSPLVGAAHARAACSSVDVLVRVDWDPSRAESVSGVVARVRYPSSLALPLDRNGRSVQGRVELRTAATGGLFDAVLNKGAGDGGGDMVSVGLINTGIPRGDFARIRFDCRAGARP